VNLNNAFQRALANTTPTQAPRAVPAVQVKPAAQPAGRQCSRCEGRGEVPMVMRGRRGGNAGGVVYVTCPVCKGKGRLP
jgi:DnaJ-class molecular chaperone